jgi:ADP-heptose:LPS heptosyltransferase
MRGLKTKKIIKGPKRIVVVDFGGIGDLVLAIPFLRGLKAAFPSYEVSVLCAERTGAILREQPYIDKLFLAPITLLGLFKTGIQLRKKRFDMAINLMPETSYFSAVKMYLLFLLINAGQWVGRNTEGRGFFYHIKVSEEGMQIENEVIFYGRILKAISDGAFEETLEFHVSQTNRKKAEELLSNEGSFLKHPLILINPGSDWPAKRWPVERYAEVVQRLNDLFPHVEFGVIGTQAEQELGFVIKKRVGENVFILSGKTPLEVLPAVLEKATLVLTNDSGPAHIARAVGTPAVILAGPSEPAYLTVRGGNESIVVQHLVSCAPCIKYACDKQDCWKAISVQEVLEVTSQLLERIKK